MCYNLHGEIHEREQWGKGDLVEKIEACVCADIPLNKTHLPLVCSGWVSHPLPLTFTPNAYIDVHSRLHLTEEQTEQVA